MLNAELDIGHLSLVIPTLRVTLLVLATVYCKYGALFPSKTNIFSQLNMISDVGLCMRSKYFIAPIPTDLAIFSFSLFENPLPACPERIEDGELSRTSRGVSDSSIIFPALFIASLRISSNLTD